jgi:cation transport protein ChaC
MADSLKELLSQRSPDNDIWLFAYGSLMWHPEISFDLSVRATIYGYQRNFCLWSTEHRGTDELPGLVLGLEPGAFCVGRAFRIPLVDHEPQLARIWAREMVTGAYHPKWVQLKTSSGTIEAIAFLVNLDHPKYVGTCLTKELKAKRILEAKGKRGSCYEYIKQTVQFLRAEKIDDENLESLYQEVRKIKSIKSCLLQLDRTNSV